MAKIWSIIFPIALCVVLAACSNNQAVNTENSNESSPSPASSTASSTTTDTPEKPDKPAENLDDMYRAYTTALQNLIQNYIFPDGSDAEPSDSGDMAQNKFALYDVDNDGKEELLLMYTDTSVAGQVGYVVAYDSETKELKTELDVFPVLTFYDNGIIKAGWSHNQGLGGDFWPYSLYQYASDSDRYMLVGMVDAWDKNYAETDTQNNSFPNDIDKSGTGFVYYIMKDGQYDDTHPVDASEYNEWINAYIGNASEIQISYMDLTEENISQIKNKL